MISFLRSLKNFYNYIGRDIKYYLTLFAKASIPVKIIILIMVTFIYIFLLKPVIKQIYWFNYDIIQGRQQDGFNVSKNGGKCVLYHMTDCGHCKAMMPEWDKFEKEVGDKALKVEASEPKAQNKDGIKGFPTIVLEDSNGKTLKTFDGERTVAGFKEFCGF